MNEKQDLIELYDSLIAVADAGLLVSESALREIEGWNKVRKYVLGVMFLWCATSGLSWLHFRDDVSFGFLILSMGWTIGTYVMNRWQIPDEAILTDHWKNKRAKWREVRIEYVMAKRALE